MKYINSFLWLCAGANGSILKRCPTEGSKYAGIGATVLFTGIFASIASGYAFYMIFENTIYSCVLGILWGVMIFNLDRYIVSSMKKTNSQYTEWKMAIPRLILATLIATVISKPLEIRMFEKEINTELTKMRLETEAAQQQSIKKQYQPSIINLEKEIAQLKDEINKARIHHTELLKIAQQEADGTGGSKKKNLGPIYKLKKADADDAYTSLLQIKQENEQLIRLKRNKIHLLEDKIQNHIGKLPKITHNGLAGRIDALSRLKGKSIAIAIADWFIFLLFVCIEVSPILVKILSNRGPYDQLLEVHEHKLSCYALEHIAQESALTRSQNIMLDDPEKSFLTKGLSSYL